MTILTILGSPRKRGNTATVLKEFEALARPHATLRRINIIDANVAGCRGCNACQRVLDRPACVQKDDANHILTRIIAADLVVYAAPVYVWDFPAQMKALMDRHYCLAKNTSIPEPTYLLKDKPTVLLTTCGGTAEENADLLRIIFRREMSYLHGRVVGEFVLPSCTLPSELGRRPHEMARHMIQHLFSAGIVHDDSK
jgi:multimeric flavodoxin WrbA